MDGEPLPIYNITSIDLNHIFERTKDDVFNFLAQRDQRDEAKKAEIQKLNPFQRVVWRKCRYLYENYCFLRTQDMYGKRIELPKGEISFSRCRSTELFNASFYSGGVFDSRRARNDPWFWPQALASLGSQLQAEKARYFMKHGPYAGYNPRSAYTTDIKEILKEASTITLSSSKRNPVGLNPERFVNRCEEKNCRAWLIGCECGTKYCELCESLKTEWNDIKVCGCQNSRYRFSLWPLHPFL